MKALALSSLRAHYRGMGQFGRTVLLIVVGLVGLLTMILSFNALSSYYPSFHEPWFLAVAIVLYSIVMTIVGAIFSGGGADEDA